MSTHYRFSQLKHTQVVDGASSAEGASQYISVAAAVLLSSLSLPTRKKLEKLMDHQSRLGLAVHCKDLLSAHALLFQKASASHFRHIQQQLQITPEGH